MEGETSAEEKKALQDKISDLNDRKECQDKQELLLKNQLKRLEDELRRVGREESRNKEDGSSLQAKIDEIALYLDSSHRLIKKVIREKLVLNIHITPLMIQLTENLVFESPPNYYFLDFSKKYDLNLAHENIKRRGVYSWRYVIFFIQFRQESMVDRNLLKLQVHKLRESLFSRADEVFSLEKRKLELNTAMTERSKEINIFKEILEAQIRSGVNDKQKVLISLIQQWNCYSNYVYTYNYYSFEFILLA